MELYILRGGSGEGGPWAHPITARCLGRTDSFHGGLHVLSFSFMGKNDLTNGVISSCVPDEE